VEYKVVRSFAGNTRGSTVELSKKDADALLAGGSPYIEAVEKKAKKTAAKPDPASPEVAAES
jgi:hypothetical protein